MNRNRIVRQRYVLGRRLVRVQPMRMRVVDAEEFEPPPAEFAHKPHHVLGRNLIVPDRISRSILRGECPRDQFVLPRQNSAALLMRLTTGVLQELRVYFATTSNEWTHSKIIMTGQRIVGIPFDGHRRIRILRVARDPGAKPVSG
jgi:hypothetical protein